ncbi:MAG TPA: SRPBCC domain-containing protein [Terracidiphilus sp.]|nr:SRPBCC domain-containing protein [Terracidiphilus sp.]
MTTAISELEDLKLSVTQEIRVDAPIDVTFDALLEQLGPGNERPDGEAMPFKLEAWPGGRWYRDLGDRNGHFWAVVQAIKRPTLLELSGPLFMSYPVANNVQYRLRRDGEGTVIEFHHLGLGLIDETHRKGVVAGWSYILGQAKKRAEQA